MTITLTIEEIVDVLSKHLTEKKGVPAAKDILIDDVRFIEYEPFGEQKTVSPGCVEIYLG